MQRFTVPVLLLLVAALLAACAPGPGAQVTVSGRVTAGPTCPVQSASPDPACDDRPVPAVLRVEDDAGREVATVRADADGGFSVDLPPGDYRIIPQPVDGILGTAEPMEVTVEADRPLGGLVIAYDTGIR
jgi:predicted small secreted protein